MPTESSDRRPAASTRVVALARSIDLDRAILYSILSRLWQVSGGFVTVILIARWFTPEVQGCYYTFTSLLGLQSFVELGLFVVIINFASHEWARLDFDAEGRLVGSREALERLVSLGRFVFAWYGVASVVFGIGVGLAGWWFLLRTVPAAIAWEWPWIALVAASSLSIFALPFVSILEGCNQVVAVNWYRFVFGVAGSVAMWLSIAGGLGLWATLVSALVAFGRDLALIAFRYRRFFEAFLTTTTRRRVSWRNEIWPMQWRLAIQGIVQYFTYSLFTPVLMYYRGPAEAGRMGMTWTAVGAIQNIALAWIQTKVPSFGMLIARGARDEFERRWRRASAVSMGVLVSGGAALLLALLALEASGLRLASRLLPAGPTALFLAGVLLMQVVQCLAAYLRAHKLELLAPASVAASLSIGALVWFLGRTFGAWGVATGFAAGVGVVSLPWSAWIWWRFRRQTTGA